MARYHRAVCLLILLLSCAASIMLGKDGNWDLLNYHFYNPYMLLTGRIAIDFLPAQTQTYLNPLMDLPTYAMIMHLKPVMVGAIMGLFHGLNLILVYLLTCRVFTFLPPRARLATGMAVTFLAATGSIVRGLWATFMGDLTVSIFVVAALYALLSASDNAPRRTRYIIGAGLLIGMGTGLKATILMHAIPLVALSFFYGATWPARIKTLIICGVSFAAGFAITYGFWAIILQQHFGSPFFPYYNALFRSPFAIARNLTDFAHWQPDSFAAHLTLPFRFLLPDGATGQAEIPFREWRPAIVFITLTLFAVFLLWRTARRYNIGSTRRTTTKPALILSAFFAVSWAIWQVQFAYYRYLAALELIAPLVIVAAIYVIVPRRTALIAIVGALFILLIPTTLPMDYGRQPWSDSYFAVEIPPTLQLQGAQILMADLDRPLAYVIPYFPESVQVLRLTSSMNPLLFFDGARGQLIDELLREIQKPRPKYVMFVNQRTRLDATKSDIRARIAQVLGQYGLQMLDGPCSKIKSAFHTINICAVNFIVTEGNTG